jgi:transcriptional regulator with XRE-family HTH domain
MSTLLSMNFPDFLEQQFLAWQQKAGKRKSLEQFAAYLGISQPLLSLWMGGRRKPGPENISLLAELFGSEIYDSLNLPRPDPDLQTLSRLWPRLTEETRQSLRKQAEKYAADNETHQAKERPSESHL